MWKRFLRVFVITALAGLALPLALILLVDPLGVSPIGIARSFGDSGLALMDRRFVAPRIIRSGNYDSFLLGTSTMHSVDPQWAEQAFGGSFANLTLHGGTPFEMSEMIKLIGRGAPGLQRIVLGIDANRWCDPRGHAKYNPRAVFPERLYDEDRLNDFSSLLNLTMLEAAYDQFKVLIGLKRAELPANGYRNQLNDAKWNAAEARKKIYGSKGIAVTALDPYEGEHLIVESASKASFPDHKLLREAADSLPAKVDLILVIMPSHASAFVNDDQAERENAEQCKRSLATEISHPRVTLVDFRISSIWTRDDTNYWDRHHIRVGLAHNLILRIKEAVERRRDAEDGVYRILPTRSTSASTRP
jgi:hypothetical protein